MLLGLFRSVRLEEKERRGRDIQSGREKKREEGNGR
jgi:hypothetical protein